MYCQISMEEKTDDLIETIKEKNRLPFESEGVLFRNRVNQRNYYNHLKYEYFKIDESNELSPRNKKIKENYEKIKRVLDEYVIEMTIEEKVSELIKTINLLGRLPKLKQFNNFEDEILYRDGTSQRNFYIGLLSLCNEAKSKECLDVNDVLALEYLDDINWYLDYQQVKKYYIEHNDLNIPVDYKIKVGPVVKEIGLWFFEQKDLYYLIDKSTKQLEHEKALSCLCEDWYDNIKVKKI